jgi:hypothetical protein
MLVLPTREQLGNLKTWEESLTEYAEGTDRALDMYRLTGHEQMKQSWRKRGYMHSSEFVLRIKKLNPLLFVRECINFPGDWAFYCDVRNKMTYLSIFSKGWMPEFSYLTVDERNLADGEKRGWRTCLLRLLSWGALHWSEVQKEFGDGLGIGASMWREKTRPFRVSGGDLKAVRNMKNKLEIN